MSSAQPPNQPPNNPPAGEKPDEQQPLLGQTLSEARPTEDAPMDTAPDQPPEETWDDIPEEIMALPTEDIQTRTRLIDNDIKVTFIYSTEPLGV
jgi:26S proteasome regulatory subunit T5